MLIGIFLFQFLALSLCHILITKVGFMYVDSEVDRQNDMSIFDVLEEKVYVLDQDTQNVLWENHAEEAAANVSRQPAMPESNEENKAAADLN